MQIAKLGDIVKITSGGTPLRNRMEYYQNGNVPWIKTGDLKVKELTEVNDYITELGLNNSSAKLFPINTVLVAMYGATIGACSIMKIEASTNQACAALLPADKVNHEYLYYYLKSIKQKLINQGVGGGQPNISATILKNTDIWLPAYNTQLHIANILSKAENLISQRKESIRLLDEYLKSVFLEMFGDPATNSKKWELLTLKDVCSKIQDGTHFSPPITNEGRPYITAKHVRENKIDFWANPWFISEESHRAIYKRCNPVKGDVLYIKDGATTGYAAINQYDFEFSMLSSLALLKVNEKIINAEYLVSWLNNPNAKASILTNMAGGAIKRLTLTKINALPILLPPLELQTQFAQIVEKIEALKAQYQQSLQELENLYGSLSQKAFKGELSLKDESLLMAAEPEMEYHATVKTLKPTSVDYYKRMVLAAEIVWQLQNEPTLGHLKLQKLIYLCQRSAEMQLPTNFLKQAMGPYDPQMMRSIDKQLKLKEWFQYNKSEFLKYVPLRNAGQHQDDFIKYFSEEQSSIQYIIDTFKTKKSDVIEITATLYACLDEMYLKNIIYSEPMLLKMFYDYSERKKNFPEHDVKQVFKAMQLKGIVPKTFKN